MNPFAVTPVTDYVRDGAALVCLLTLLGMPWDLDGNASDRWWVVLGALVAVLALPLPYVGRARIIPGWTAQHVRLTKLALTVPLWIGVLAALINELINVDDDFSGGIGAGVAVAVAGALLTVQPRGNDENRDRRGARGWLLAARIAAAAAAATVPIGVAAFVLHDAFGDQFVVSDVLTVATLVVVALVPPMVAVVWPALASLGGSAPWSRVLATVGFATLAAALLAAGSDLDFAVGVEKWYSPVGGTFVIAAAAALAVSRPVHQAAAGRRDPAADWLATAAAALSVSALLNGIAAVSLVILLLQLGGGVPSVIVVIVMLAVTAVLPVVAAAMTGAAPRGRVAVLVLASAQLLLTTVTVAVAGGQDVPVPSTALLLGAPFALPALALYALTVPPSVRTALGPVIVASERPAPHAYQ